MKIFIPSFLFVVVIAIQPGFSQWTFQESGITNHIYGVDFINENIGFATCNNGDLLKSKCF